MQPNYLASPPLVVTYALAGTVNDDLSSEPIGNGNNGQSVYLKDIWPSNHEVQQMIADNITNEMFGSKWSNVFEGYENWKYIKTSTGHASTWDSG